MNTIIVYTSMTGTTELMATTIAKELIKLGETVDQKDAMEIFVEELKSYDKILIGSYTWGDGELPDELLDFYNEVKNTDLTGKTGAVFGPGDSCYEHFARAVDILEQTLKSRGCEIITDGLKVDRESDEQIKSKCRIFSNKLVI
ncbi:flavodoxin [Calidifontibacillus oryziterrae]|uniref:flavodoxin n=1 Tax=Calidifontibacillus oryziterrae TaxID=1191699 RepID=UPI0002E5959E|nr:flavodoxin [Calidifontibacillus oryziterrae]